VEEGLAAGLPLSAALAQAGLNSARAWRRAQGA